MSFVFLFPSSFVGEKKKKEGKGVGVGGVGGGEGGCLGGGEKRKGSSLTKSK